MSWFSDLKDDVVSAVNSVPVIGPVVAATSGFFTGGVSGASVATGGEVTPQTLAIDATGLAAGAGIASSGLLVGDPLAGYVVNPETGDVIAATGSGSASSGLSLGSILSGANTALDGVLKLTAVQNALKARNTAGTNGQRADVAPLAGTWGTPGTPQYRNTQGTYGYQPAAQAAGASSFLPWILVAAVGILFAFLIARR